MGSKRGMERLACTVNSKLGDLLGIENVVCQKDMPDNGLVRLARCNHSHKVAYNENEPYLTTRSPMKGVENCHLLPDDHQKIRWNTDA